MILLILIYNLKIVIKADDLRAFIKPFTRIEYSDGKYIRGLFYLQKMVQRIAFSVGDKQLKFVCCSGSIEDQL